MLLSGALGYGLLGTLGSVLPYSGVRLLPWVLVCSGGLVSAWYIGVVGRWLPSSKHQMRKAVAEDGYTGAMIYGCVLGVGVLSIVVSPLVWCGVLLAIASGSLWWGVIYGVAFGVGRASHFVWQARLGIPEERSAVPIRVLRGEAGWARSLGVAAGAVLVLAGAVR